MQVAQVKHSLPLALPLALAALAREVERGVIGIRGVLATVALLAGSLVAAEGPQADAVLFGVLIVFFLEVIDEVF